MTSLQLCDEVEARALTDEIQGNIEQAFVAMARMWEGRGWKALGYRNWQAYCDAELYGISVSRDARPALIEKLFGIGMSQRAISAMLQVDKGTIRNDIARGEISPPEVATGQDGKQYPAARPGPGLADVNREHAARTADFEDVELPDTPGVVDVESVDVTPCRVCGRVDLDDGEYWEDSDLCDTCAARTGTHPDLDMDDGAKQRRCGLCDTWWPGWDALDEHITEVHVPVTPTNDDDTEDGDEEDAPHLSWNEVAGEAWALHDLADGVLNAWPTGVPAPVQMADIRNDLLIAQDRIRDMLRRLPEQPAIRAAS